jgi:hypothetical protein
MKMQASRSIALAVLLLVVVGAGLVLVLRGGSDSGQSATASGVGEVTADSEREPPTPPAPESSERLRLPKRGTPLVWVRQGEEAEIRSSPGGPATKTVGDETQWGSHTIFHVAETDGEWAGVPNPYSGNGALGWVKLDPERLKAGYTTHAIEIDLSDHRVQLLREGEAIRTFTVSVGAPGSETPTGSFAVTDTFRGDLNPAYGCCAVALTAVQPRLPSGWIGGNRIAIHGTTGPLGVNVSHGCVRAADRDVSALVDKVPPGAPVTIRQ